MIFDEVQYVPDIFRYIKIEVDKNREYYGNFILTGSSNFLMNKHISESLAGRAANINILPLDITEIPKDLLQNSIFQGAYPENVINSYKSWKRWYSNYINLYLQKDIRMMSNIGNMNSFKDFFRLLALRASKVLNLSEISKDLGIVVNTVKNWLSLFEASFITFRLYPYHSNLGKRIIKSPKLYFFDTGIISTLTAINSYELFLNGPLKGEIFENYIVSELFKRNNNLDLGFSMYYYRKSNGDEIDLIIEKDNNIDA